MSAAREVAPAAEHDQAPGWDSVRVLRVAVVVSAVVVVIVASPPLVWGIVWAAWAWPVERGA